MHPLRRSLRCLPSVFLVVLLAAVWSSRLATPVAGASNDATLSYFVTGFGQTLRTWGPSDLVRYTGVSQNSGGNHVVANQTTPGGTMQYRVLNTTTNTVARTWTAIAPMVNSATFYQTPGDTVIELNSTAADGVTWLVYTLVCYCDVPQLQTAADSPTITGANGQNVFYTNYVNTYRIYLPVTIPTTQMIHVEVTNPVTPYPACTSTIYYAYGESDDAFQTIFFNGRSTRFNTELPASRQAFEALTVPPTKSPIPGRLTLDIPWTPGRSWLLLWAVNPVGRYKYNQIYTLNPFAAWYVAAGPYGSIIEKMGCEAYDRNKLVQAPCFIPFYTSILSMQFQKSVFTYARFWLNGVNLFNQSANPYNVDIPILVGSNILRVDTIVGTYEREIIIPPPGTITYPPLKVLIRASADKLISSSLLVITGALALEEDTRTNVNDITWAWSATSSSGGAFNFSSYVQPSTAIGLLQQQQLILLGLPPDVYSFSVTAVDSNYVRPDQFGYYRNTTLTMTITVEVDVKPLPPTTVDPCAEANPCKNGQQCTAVADGQVGPANNTSPASRVSISGTAYALYCTCTSVRPQFFGSDCSFAVLGCYNCMASYASDTNLTLYGIGLTSAVRMSIGDVPSVLQSLKVVNGSSADYIASALAALKDGGFAQTELIALTFIAPRLVNTSANDTVLSRSLATLSGNRLPSVSSSSPLSSTRRHLTAVYLSPDVPIDDEGEVIDAYLPMQVAAALPGRNQETQLRYQTLVYYSSSTCREPGQWKPDGQGGCLECPEGAYCPGANRVWPLEGHYGYSEYVAPVSCRVFEACTGMNIQLALGSAGGTEDYFKVGNEPAKCQNGYAGVKCSECAEGYYQQQFHCYACDESVNQSSQLTLVIIAVAVVVLVLSFCVALMDTEALCVAVGRFLMLQQIATVGVSAAPSLPSHAQEVGAFFAWIDTVNFNLQLLKPGCAGIPSFTFTTQFFSIILFMFLTGLLFTVACCFRYLWKKHRYEQDLERSAAEAAEYEVRKREREAKNKQRAMEEENGDAAAAKKNGKKHVAEEEEDEEEEEEVPLPPSLPVHDFRKRLIHSILILLAIMYLRVTALLCLNFVCSEQPLPVLSTASNAPVDDALLLDSDGSTRCYHDVHSGSTAVAIFFMLAYILMFPLVVFILLLRSFGSERTSGISGWLWRHVKALRGDRAKQEEKLTKNLNIWQEKQAAESARKMGETPRVDRDAQQAKTIDIKGRPQEDDNAVVDSSADAKTSLIARLLARDQSDRFGFLYDGLREEEITFVIHMLFIQFLFAVVQVFFEQRPLLQLFLYGLVTFLDCLHTAWALPWDGYKENLTAIALSAITLIQGSILLGTQDDGVHSPYFALSIAMGGIILLVLGVPHLRKVRFERKKKVQDGEKMRAADAEGHTNEVEMEPVAASEKNNRMSIDAGPANGGVSSNELHVRVRQRSQSGFVAAGDSPASSLAAVDDAVQPISPREIVGTLVHAASQQEEHAVLPSPSHNSAAPTDAASSDQHLSPEEAAAVRAHALSLTSEPAIASIEEVDSPSNGKRRLAIHKPKHFPTGEQSDA